MPKKKLMKNYSTTKKPAKTKKGGGANGNDRKTVGKSKKLTP